MDLQELYFWCILMLPLLLSPGPANIAVANVSSSRGYKAAMLFSLGITSISLVILSVLGFSLKVVQSNFQDVFRVLELAGAVFIVYLGLKIFLAAPSQENGENKALTVKEGLFLQALNGKVYPTIIMMFTRFLSGEGDPTFKILELSFLVLFVSFLSYMLWAAVGLSLQKLGGKTSFFIQRYGFGGFLVLTGLFLFFN